MLPILMMLLSGLIEFGFLLNSYLDVIDAAREAARFAANDDPTIGSPTDFVTPNFWNRAYRNSRGSLFTASDGRINWTPTDPADCATVNGDILVSGFAFVDNTIKLRFPGVNVGASNCPLNGYQTKLSDAEVNAKLDAASIDNSGAVMVEIYYEYDMVLGLPWITAFVPDPVVLHSYTIMPNTYAELDDTVTLCHHATSQTIEISVADPALPAHFYQHGDSLGPCP